MATRMIALPILGALLDATNPPGITFINGRPKLLFDDSTDEIIRWQFRMPSDYASAPVLRGQFSMASATSGSVVWSARLMAVTPGDSQDMDSDSYDSANTDTEAVPATAGYLDEFSITISNADGVAAGDYVCLELSRDADNGSDDASGDAELWSGGLEYTTN